MLEKGKLKEGRWLKVRYLETLDKIYAIMDEYGIPHTEPIFVDRLDGYKRHKK